MGFMVSPWAGSWVNEFVDAELGLQAPAPVKLQRLRRSSKRTMASPLVTWISPSMTAPRAMASVPGGDLALDMGGVADFQRAR